MLREYSPDNARHDSLGANVKRILLLTIYITLLVDFVYGQQTNPAEQIPPDGVFYSVFSLKEGDPRQALKASIEGIESSTGWDRTTQRDLRLDGFSGKQYLPTSPLGGAVQVFATKNRFYRFQAFAAAYSLDSVPDS